MELRPLIILGILVVLNVLLTRRDLREFRVFQTYRDSASRQRMLRRWVLTSVLFHGLAAVALLIGMDRVGAILRLPVELHGLASLLRPAGDGPWPGVLKGMLLAFPFVLLLGPTVMTVIDVRRRCARGKRMRDDSALQARNAASLIPRNPTERLWTTLLSLNAGLSEELYFRLLLPVLITLAGGSPLLGVTLATLWFGLVHLYQGKIGVLATTLTGVVLMLVYLSSGQLWLVMLIHAVVDLNGLALAPWLEERWLGPGESERV